MTERDDQAAITELLSRITITDESLKGALRLEITIPNEGGSANIINIDSPPTPEQLSDLAAHLPIAEHLREQVIAHLFAPRPAD